MNYALYELAQQPDLQERLREEINEVLEQSNGEITYDNIKQMPYLQQVLDGKFSVRYFSCISVTLLFSSLHRICAIQKNDFINTLNTSSCLSKAA